MRRWNTPGFTLIELLIAVGIMAILATLTFPSIIKSRQAGRDTRRKTDLQMLQAALESYKLDQRYSIYPNNANGLNALISNPDPNKKYISSIPVDPLSIQDYRYVALPTSCNNNNPATWCLKYILCARLESEPGNSPASCGSYTCGSGLTCNYEVRNP